jgi:hypothetical protein
MTTPAALKSNIGGSLQETFEQYRWKNIYNIENSGYNKWEMEKIQRLVRTSLESLGIYVRLLVSSRLWEVACQTPQFPLFLKKNI